MADSPQTDTSFKKLAAAQGLNEKTITVLENEDCCELDDIRILNSHDIDELRITQGQKAKLRTWITQLQLNPQLMSDECSTPSPLNKQPKTTSRIWAFLKRIFGYIAMLFQPPEVSDDNKNVSKMAEILTKLGLEDLIENFEKQMVGPTEVLDLNDNQLKDLGVDRVDQQTLLRTRCGIHQDTSELVSMMAEILTELGLEELIGRFYQQKIRPTEVLNLNDDQLKDLGVDLVGQQILLRTRCGTHLDKRDLVSKMAEILTGLGLKDLIKSFEQQKIGPTEVLDLNDDQLKDLGVNLTGQQTLLRTRCGIHQAKRDHAKTDYDIAERGMMDKKLTQLDRTEAKLKGAHDCEELNLVMNSALHDYMASEVHIAVTGQSGAGKSSLINSLRSLRPTDKGAAQTGTSQTTKNKTPYPFPNNPNLVLWDLPGVGTSMFPQDDYIKAVGLTNFQALIICTFTRFTESDIWLVDQAHKHNITYYIVRTKIDIDVENILDCGADMRKAFDEIERHITCDIKTSIHPNIYLLSTKLKYHTKWDFPKLIQSLTEDTPEKDKQVILKTMISCSKDIIEAKKKSLEKGIGDVAKKASKAPISEYQGIIRGKVKEYMTWFGLSDDELDRVGIKLRDLDKRLQNMLDELEEIKNTDTEEYTGYRDAYRWIPYIGYRIGKAWDDTENLKREEEHSRKIQKISLINEICTPLEIENATTGLLEALLETCVKTAKGILAERQRIVEIMDVLHPKYNTSPVRQGTLYT